MANKNRTEVSAAIQAVAAIVDEASYKATLDTNFAQSVVFRKDVSDTETASGGTLNVLWDGLDFITVTQTGNVIYVNQEIEQGEIKYLKINKGNGDTITFSGTTLEDENTDYITTLTSILFEIFDKDGTPQARAITKTIPSASEANKGIAPIVSTVNAIAATNDTDIMTPAKTADLLGDNSVTSIIPYATTSLNGVIQLSTITEAEAEANSTTAMSPLQVKNARLNAFDKWVAISYNSGDYSGGWAGDATSFEARYLIIGKTVFFNMSIRGTADTSSTSLIYNLPSAIAAVEVNASAISVTATRSGVQKISGAQVLNGDVTIYNDVNFTSGTWIIAASGTWEIV